MAFEWNWRGNQNAYDAYKTAEDLAAKRYWANRDYMDAQNQAIANQSADQGMRGIANPAGVYAQPNLDQAQAAYQQALANAPAMYEAQMQAQQQDALRAELAQNEQRIAQIKMEIQRLRGQSSQYLDNMDMRLAENRARIGDMGNAIAHQNRIITRQQLANANTGSSTPKDLEGIEDKIINAYREYAFAENDEQKQVAQYDINRFKDQYKKQTGKEFKGNPFSVELGTPTNADTFAKARAKLDASKDKNGRYTEAAWKEFEKDIKNVPWSQVDNDYVTSMMKVGSQEAAASARAKLAAKQKAALDEAKLHIIPTVLDENGSQEYTATNGQKVTITRSGFGKAVLTIGKLVENVNY